MERTQLSFEWDDTFYEGKLNKLTNFQMGFVGAALMLMMMDLSKLYLLLPLGVGLILVSWYKNNIDKTREEFRNSSLSFAPKSILFQKPTENLEQRIEFRVINDVTLHKEHFVDVVTLYLDSSDKKVSIKGFRDSKALSEQLLQAISK